MAPAIGTFRLNAIRSILASHRRLATITLPLVALATVLIVGSVRDDHFWSKPDRRGDRLLRAGRFADAAKTYEDPDRVGVALYRNGDFEAAAKTFARVPGSDGAFNQGNAWLMHGQYDRAIESYDRALSVRPGWQDAADNRAIAVARRDRIKNAATQDVAQDTGETPDKIVFDLKGEDNKGKPVELSGGDAMSDAELQASWLRNVRTTPGDFLRAKFAYQAQAVSGKEGKP